MYFSLNIVFILNVQSATSNNRAYTIIRHNRVIDMGHSRHSLQKVVRVTTLTTFTFNESLASYLQSRVDQRGCQLGYSRNQTPVGFCFFWSKKPSGKPNAVLVLDKWKKDKHVIILYLPRYKVFNKRNKLTTAIEWFVHLVGALEAMMRFMGSNWLSSQGITGIKYLSKLSV